MFPTEVNLQLNTKYTSKISDINEIYDEMLRLVKGQQRSTRKEEEIWYNIHEILLTCPCHCISPTTLICATYMDRKAQIPVTVFYAVWEIHWVGILWQSQIRTCCDESWAISVKMLCDNASHQNGVLKGTSPVTTDRHGTSSLTWNLIMELNKSIMELQILIHWLP